MSGDEHPDGFGRGADIPVTDELVKEVDRFVGDFFLEVDDAGDGGIWSFIAHMQRGEGNTRQVNPCVLKSVIIGISE